MAIAFNGKRVIAPTHPGEMLREDFIPDYGLTVAGLASAPCSASREMADGSSGATATRAGPRGLQIQDRMRSQASRWTSVRLEPERHGEMPAWSPRSSQVQAFGEWAALCRHFHRFDTGEHPPEILRCGSKRQERTDQEIHRDRGVAGLHLGNPRLARADCLCKLHLGEPAALSLAA